MDAMFFGSMIRDQVNSLSTFLHTNNSKIFNNKKINITRGHEDFRNTKVGHSQESVTEVQQCEPVRQNFVTTM